MNTPKYKLLVLTDLSEACNTALENAVNLSKIINGSVEVFHVLKPSDIAEYENQLSAMRSIDEERVNKKAKLKTLVREISKKTGVTITASSILGNLKDETMERIEAVKPDIVVLGKRTQKLINFLGDGFTKFILDTFNGSVLISGKDKIMSPSEAMSIGLFNTTPEELSLELTKDLRKHTKNPIKRFKVRTDAEKAEAIAENVITYEFENGSNTMNNIASYVAKNNIGLLCMNPHTKKSTGPFQGLRSNIKQAIQKINVPILIVNNQASIQLQ
ncbi:universal stress protein [Kordia sp. YSTF-M3]|uniref:Universal stress protein n=1 Tax=Kordia aestuariivivens TaxID=2759037 RepID=A0ABR7QDV6_9FLAO|nr:universal stress protein [Kordia aestuariivivens]MBC8756747.1 universal stress protein [Kordia aestuariivivens]